jgi:hypothetical protein
MLTTAERMESQLGGLTTAEQVGFRVWGEQLWVEY